jgi:hypothetical protein
VKDMPFLTDVGLWHFSLVAGDDLDTIRESHVCAKTADNLGKR